MLDGPLTCPESPIDAKNKVCQRTFTLAVLSPDFWTFQNNNSVTSNVVTILESPKVRTKHCLCECALRMTMINTQSFVHISEPKLGGFVKFDKKKNNNLWTDLH